MSDVKHTKGPWKAIGLQIYADRGEVNTWVANVKQGRADAVEIADAHLIAAAPELLETLEGICNHGALADNEYLSAGLKEKVANARTAIAKAKGDV